jgi:prepilin signal peptidase PulO-like enzyme (type II secretory pathway)
MPHLTGFDLPFSFYAVFAFVLGLIFGSFLNVVIHRIPLGASLVFPGSHCPACGAPIRAFDNIPLVSFALLGGRCRRCRGRISFAYPMVELGAGLAFVAIVFKTGPSWEALFEFAFACAMISLIFIDARHHLLPNAIIYPALLFAGLAAPARAALGEHPSQAPSLISDISTLFLGFQSDFTPWRAALFGAALFAMPAPGFWLLDKLDPILFGKYFDREDASEEDARQKSSLPQQVEPELQSDARSAIRATMILGLIAAAVWALMVVFISSKHQPAFEDAYEGLLRASAGALVGGGLLWCIRALYFFIRGFEGMGLGDVKMMSVVGAFLGLGAALGVLLLGSIIGVIIGLILIYKSRGERALKTPAPFGACLGAASLLVMILSPL